ncbi:MAG: rhodanese-like domain-containing protein [Thermomicrobiales bacterium]
MKLERIYTPGLAQVAYIIGDEDAGVAALIDPRRDVQEYIDRASAAGLTITQIYETHVHADFVSGAPELARATGATVYASRIGESEFPHQPLDDGDVIALGNLRITALWTPGHTPEHMAFLLTDPASDAPGYLFSGDMLFVGEIGRPDLLGAEHTDDLLAQLHTSVFERLMPLDDAIIVYPGHGAGSSCGRTIGDADSTTIGQEKRFNYAFRPRNLAEFREAIMANMPPAPAYYPTMKRVNKVGATPLAGVPASRALAADEVAGLIAGGALAIDTRPAEAFGGAHIPGALFAGLGTDLVNWAGWYAPYDRDVVLVLEHDEQFAEVRTELARIGIDRVAGYLAGGMTSWETSGRDIATLAQISTLQLEELLRKHEAIVIDARSLAEWQEGHIDGALHRFAGQIVTGDVDIPAAGPVAIICGSGYRSSVAASVLLQQGWQDVINVPGGMDGWRAAGLPTTTDSAASAAGIAKEEEVLA